MSRSEANHLQSGFLGGWELKNIYQLYEENRNRAGFKVRRTSWGRTVAVIKSIGGKTRGKLSGYAPYYGSQRVVAEIHTPSGIITDVLSCAGCYQWERVD